MPPEYTDEDAFAWWWLLWADAGHLDCVGYTYDPRDGQLICSCGAALFAVKQVAA